MVDMTPSACLPHTEIAGMAHAMYTIRVLEKRSIDRSYAPAWERSLDAPASHAQLATIRREPRIAKTTARQQTRPTP